MRYIGCRVEAFGTGNTTQTDAIYHFDYRFYMPFLHSFPTKDILYLTNSGIIINPLFLNPYLYSSNNPSNFIDPYGLFGIEGSAMISYTKNWDLPTQPSETFYLYHDNPLNYKRCVWTCKVTYYQLIYIQDSPYNIFYTSKYQKPLKKYFNYKGFKRDIGDFDKPAASIWLNNTKSKIYRADKYHNCWNPLETLRAIHHNFSYIRSGNPNIITYYWEHYTKPTKSPIGGPDILKYKDHLGCNFAAKIKCAFTPMYSYPPGTAHWADEMYPLTANISDCTYSAGSWGCDNSCSQFEDQEIGSITDYIHCCPWPIISDECAFCNDEFDEEWLPGIY